QEVRQLLVDLLVDEEDGQALAGARALGEEALVAVAVDDGPRELGFARLALVIDELDVVDAQVAEAPGATGERERRLAQARGVVGQGRLHLLEAVGGRALADPEAHGEAGVAEPARIALTDLFERADQRRGAPELIEGQEAQRVAED